MYLTVGAVFLPVLTKAQISNVRVFPEGERTVIVYDYARQDEAIDDVVVTYTTGNGSEKRVAKQISGDLRNIRPGSGKRIVWSSRAEAGDVKPEKLNVRLTGVRNKTKQAMCNDNINMADNYFRNKDYTLAVNYYESILNCASCNCNTKDVAYASDQVRIARQRMEPSRPPENVNTRPASYSSEPQRVVQQRRIPAAYRPQENLIVSYLYDMPMAVDAGGMHGVSVLLLRNSWDIGGYASFRTTSHFYSPQDNMSYYTNEKYAYNYGLSPTATTRRYSWLFSAGITRKAFSIENTFIFAYGGIGIGTNNAAVKYNVTEKGYTSQRWVSDGGHNLVFSPEVGAIADLNDRLTLMAGIKFPLSVTKSELLEKKNGISLMLGAGIRIKSLRHDYNRFPDTYIAYAMDIPALQPSEKLQSMNFIGFSIGRIGYDGLGAYLSARANLLLFNSKKVGDLNDYAFYRGLSDYGNAFITGGVTWMYFYGGLGISYQKEYKSYMVNNTAIWNSQRSDFGICTEFGLNLRLFDNVLLRGGITFPGFKLSSEDNEFTMGSNKMYYSLGLGYVFASDF